MLLIIAGLALAPLHASSLMVIDRVVAFIGDDAITMRELVQEHDKRIAMKPSESRQETLDALINTRLLLKAARHAKISLGSVDEKAILDRYIELKIRASVLISDTEAKKFYRKNKDRFKGAEFSAVRPEIIKYLEEKRFNDILSKHIEQLRRDSRIVVLDID